MYFNLLITTFVSIANNIYTNKDLFRQFITEWNDNCSVFNLDAFSTCEIDSAWGIGYDASSVFVDLKGDAGYMVFSKNGELLDYSVKGDYLETKNCQDCCLTCFGFETCRVHRIMQDSDLVADVGYSSSNLYSSSYIEYSEIGYYLSQKYGYDSFTIMQSGKLNHLDAGCSSVGYTVSDGELFGGEGNCGVISTSNAIAYLSSTGNFSRLPSRDSTVYIPIQNMPDYAASIQNGYYPMGYSRGIKRICERVRYFAALAGYASIGMNDDMTKSAFENTMSYYNYYGNFLPIENMSLSELEAIVDMDYVLQLRTYGDVVYGGHGMMVTGYRVYETWAYIGGLQAHIVIPFLSVFDGAVNRERWYDLTSLSNAGSYYNRASSQTFAWYLAA